MTEHIWATVKRHGNGTWLWRCSACGSTTWTVTCEYPEEGDLENSGTHGDCTQSKQIVDRLGLRFGQPSTVPLTRYELLLEDDEVL